jgi:hypothetical protein
MINDSVKNPPHIARFLVWSLIVTEINLRKKRKWWFIKINVCMYVCMYVFTYMYMYVCMCEYVWIFVYRFFVWSLILTEINLRKKQLDKINSIFKFTIYIFVCVNMYKYVYANFLYDFWLSLKLIWKKIQYVWMCIYINIYAYICACIYMHIYINA